MSKKEVACYELTMPRVGSHNGKWSGEDRKYYCLLYGDMTRHKQLLETGKNWFHDFKDGRCACVSLEIIGIQEARKRSKISAGFSTYEWMIDNILQTGNTRGLTEPELGY